MNRQLQHPSGAIRTAVVGYGVSGRIFHAPFIASNPSYSLDCIVTANSERADDARSTHPHAAVVASPSEMFERADDLDLVVIGTPPGTHAELASAALDHGLNVVVDKPFVASSREAEVLIAKAEQVGRRLTVFQNRRWDADFLTLRRLIEAGELGTVTAFESRFEVWKPDGFRGWKDTTPVAEAGGVLFDLGSHLIDQALQLFGPVEKVVADVVRRTHSDLSDADDDAQVTLLHTSGTRSELHMSALAAMPGPRFHVLGTRAAYTKWGLDSQEPTLLDGAWPTDPDFGVEPRECWGSLGVAEKRHQVEPERGVYSEFYRLLAAALAGEGPLPVDPRESLEVLRIIEQAHDFRRTAPIDHESE